MKEYKDYAKITAHFDLAIEEAIKFGGDVGKHVVLLFETMRNKLDTVPAADVVEVRHGRVIVHEGREDEYYEYCSECKTMDVHSGDNFCPNCGCKFVGVNILNTQSKEDKDI